MRRLIVIVVASSTFGGAVGALATAATQSQASPAAIAAAVQRVQDQKAERTLSQIKTELSTTASSAATLRDIDARLNLGNIAGALSTMQAELFDICLNTGSATTICPTPSPEARR